MKIKELIAWGGDRPGILLSRPPAQWPQWGFPCLLLGSLPCLLLVGSRLLTSTSLSWLPSSILPKPMLWEFQRNDEWELCMPDNFSDSTLCSAGWMQLQVRMTVPRVLVMWLQALEFPVLLLRILTPLLLNPLCALGKRSRSSVRVGGFHTEVPWGGPLPLLSWAL